MIDLPEIGKEYSWREILGISTRLGLVDVSHILINYPPPDHPFVSDG